MKKLFVVIALLLIGYFLGPTPDTPTYDRYVPDLPNTSESLETYVQAQENKFEIKPENDAQIVWADPSRKEKTKVAVVYLHGFSASRKEGFPTHRRFAKKYGCNMYLARLSDHGIISDDPLLEFTPDRIWETAKEAYAIGKKLGDEVIIMSTSTGGTLALLLAANYKDIKGLINFSPNIEINNSAAWLLNNPWGLQIARLKYGGNFRDLDQDPQYQKYWYDRYRVEAIVQLQELVETACTEENFNKITCPVFNGVYYKDEEHQDQTVKVSAVRKMHSELGTSENKKVLVEFPTAGNHVIANSTESGAVPEVFDAISSFAEEVFGIQPSKN